MNVYDLLLDQTDGDLLIQNGDLVIGIANQELLNSLLVSHTGEWKQNPDVGINLELYINSNFTSTLLLEQDIKSEMINDGFIVNSINIMFDNFKQVNIAINQGITNWADRKF